MLEFLHTRGHLKKVPTNLVLMTPNTQTSIQLDELNKIIAEQKGISVEQLAIKDETNSDEFVVDTNPVVVTPVAQPASPSANTLRSKADELLAEAKALRELADSMDPPKKAAAKTKKATVTA